MDRTPARLTPFVVLLVMSVFLGLPGSVRAQEDCEDEIIAWSVEDTVFVEHLGAWYNCCVLLAVEMETPEPNVIDFLEAETYPEGPCYCECCLSVGMQGTGFESGTYLVRVWNEDRTELFGETTVEVAGEDTGSGVLDWFGQSPCGGYSNLEDDFPGEIDRGETWGRVKQLFQQ